LGGYGRHREMEEFFAWAVTGGTGVNRLTGQAKVKSVTHDELAQMCFNTLLLLFSPHLPK